MSSKRRRSPELLEAARKFREAPSTTDVAIRHFLSALDTPRSLTVWLLFRNKEHDQLTALDCHPAHYNDAQSFRDAYTATNFLAKASFLKTSFNREAVALEKFEEYESLCKRTNSRFRNPHLDPLHNGSNVWLLHATKRKIMQILGDFSADEFVDGANWGPGVSTLIKGEHVSAINKFHDERGITRDLYSLVEPWLPAAYPLWFNHLSRCYGESWMNFQVGNDIVTVPKNSKTDRVIAIEPGWNLWFQKAIGTMIRRRLLRVGIDLNNQSINQRLALLGSKYFKLATVDFSSASDSIALELVREVLPPRWFQIMDICRSHYGKSSNGPRRWEKFSSMGNGFTFELESLIFYAAAEAVAEYSGALTASEPISVYGDDVIIPSSTFELFSSFSEFLGFRVNPKKSFSSGSFRESCGSHYFGGIDCKPVYLKEKLRHVESFFKLANSVRLLAHRRNSHYGCDHSFLECWHHLYYRVPEPLRLWSPLGAGDVGFVGNFDEATPTRARYGIEGYTYSALSQLGISQETDSEAVLLARLWVPSVQEYGNNYTLRGRSRRRLTTSIVQQWYNLGPWM